MQAADRRQVEIPPPDAMTTIPMPMEPEPGITAVESGAGSKVARNTLIMLAAQLVTFGLTFIWTVVVQHMLSVGDVGHLFFAQSLAWTGAIFMDAGVSTYLSKHVARDREETSRLLSNALLLRTATTVIVYAIILAYPYLAGKSQGDIWTVALVGAAIVVAAYTQAFAATFQGRETMLWPALGTIAEKTVVTALSVTLLLMGYGLLAVAGVMLLGAAANLLIVGRKGIANGWIHLRLEPKLIKSIVIGGAPFFLWAAFGVIYQRNAAFVLDSLAGDVTTGWFAVAVRLYETLSFIPYIFQAAILPALARGFMKGGDSNGHVTSRRSLNLIILSAMPIATLVALLAPWIIELITAGLDQYSNSVLPLRILGLGLIPLYIDMILATIIISADKQKQWAFVAVGAAVLNPLLNWGLIEWSMSTFQNGAIGAALVTFLTEAIILFFYLALVPRGVLVRSNFNYFLKVAVSAGLMALAVWGTLPLLLSLSADLGHGKLGATMVLVPEGIIGMAVFAVAAYLFKLVGPDELRLLTSAVKRSR